MPKTNAVINMKDISGKKVTKSITDISNSATNQQIQDFAQGLVGVTNNYYDYTNKVVTTKVDSESDKQTPTLKLTLENGTDVSTVTTNTTYIIVNSGDGDSYINCSPANASSDIFWGYSQAQGQPVKRTILFTSNSFTTLKIMSPETASFNAANIQYNFA